MKEAPTSERFRLLAILATLDPESGEWPAQAGPAVEQFLAANPLYLGPWKAALEPVRAALLAPLGKAFRDSGESDRRRFVATLLADYAAERPEVLVDLLLDADERQYAALLPKVGTHRERAVPLLTTELDKTLSPEWKDTPLDPTWSLDAALACQVEAAEGMVAERFALCQMLPLEEFDALAGGLAKAGYRLLQLRPYGCATAVPAVGRRETTAGIAVARGTVLVAALWTRDGGEARWAHGRTAAEVTMRDAEERGRGLVPLDVTGYLAGAEERYAAVWGPKDAGLEGVRLLVGVSPEKDRADGGAWQKAGFVPRTQGILFVGGTTRHSAVWWKPPRVFDINRFSDDWSEGQYESALTPSHLQVDLRLAWSPAHLERRQRAGVALLAVAPFAGMAGLPWEVLYRNHAYQEQGVPGVSFSAVCHDVPEWVSEEAHGLEPAAHRMRWRELAAQGYRPAAVTVTSLGETSRLLAGSVWHCPVVAEAAKDALARRQAQAAVALLQLGAPERVWPLLEHRPDPRVRGFLIHRLEPLKAEVQTLLGRLKQEREVSRRRALVLALGSYPVEAGWLPRLRQWYREEPDAGLHGAVEWLLRRWGDGAEVVAAGKAMARKEIERKPGDGRQWHVNGQGQTMVLIPAGVTFAMGSPGNEAGRVPINEPLHQVRIGRSFALAAKEVTVDQFLRFRPDHGFTRRYSPNPDGPAVSVTWYQAAEYCNWLSAQEGLRKEEWCYVANERGAFGPGMKVASSYLSKRGYRLPTEAEWECACRAGAATRRFYGEADALLGEYAWYADTTKSENARAGGLLKPNDLGLFDVYGNAAEWAGDPLLIYRRPRTNKYKEDFGYINDIKFISDDSIRPSRGGSFDLPSSYLRSAHRVPLRPSGFMYSVGFRVARTMD